MSGWNKNNGWNKSSKCNKSNKWNQDSNQDTNPCTSRNKWTGWLSLAAVLVLTAVVLEGCGVKTALLAKGQSEKEYGQPETLVFLTTERLRYEALYSDQIWTAAVDNRGTTFETVLLSQVRDFMKELKIMSRMAEEEKVVLSSREKELVKEAAKEYLAALGEENEKKFSLETRTLEDLYEDYWTADKLVDTQISGANLEVSDSEAKVITIAQIELTDQTAAEELLSKVQAEGSDFTALAKQYSEDSEIQKELYRGLRGAEYEAAAYGLATGEISGVLSDSGKYYIVKCLNDYDEAATRIHKEQMVREKKNKAFYDTYQAYQAEISLSGDDGMWERLTITGTPAVTADFFEIYEQICGKTE